MNRKTLLLLFLTLLLTFTAGSVFTEAAVKNGLKKEDGQYYYYKDGKKLKNRWKKIGDDRYYLGSDGAAYRGHKVVDGMHLVFLGNAKLLRPSSGTTSFVTHPTTGEIYYMTAFGNCSVGGWKIINNNLYFADSIGRLKKDCTYQRITFDSSAKAVKDTYGLCKIRAMQIVKSITNSSMTKAEKLRACWNYIVNSFEYRVYTRDDTSEGWQKREAYYYLTHDGYGDCESCSCGFAALAAEVGYTPYVIHGRVPGTRDGAADGFTTHFWVEIDNKIYDPEGHAAGWNMNVYGYSSYNLNHQILSWINYITG